MVVTFVTEKAFQGDFGLSPYNFRHKFGDPDAAGNTCAIDRISLSLNGVEISGLPTDELKLHYLKMFMFTDMKDNNYSNDITYEKFGGGYFFSFFDLTTSLTSSSTMLNPVTRMGQAR
jgi:hypothetical protein